MKYLLYLYGLQQERFQLGNFFGLELLLVAIVTLIALSAPRFGSRFFLRIENRTRAIAVRPAAATVLAAIVPVGFRLLLLPVMPLPQPKIHDEFSHLLAADTFAHGRLVNPGLRCWEHFESFHINVTPAYVSMEPPLHGMMLAAGQVLFQTPWAGVVLEAVLMSALSTWMLYGWLRPYWALTGGLIVAVRFGVFSYWMNSYWGGALAAAGGALVLGALPRLLRKPSVGSSFLMGLGAVVLAGTRPFEGLTVCMAVAAAFTVALVRRRLRFNTIAQQIAAPVLLTVIPAAAWYLYYNHRTTGDALKMAHQVNRAQYAVVPYWIWQPMKPAPAYNHQVMRKFFTEYEPEVFEKTIGNWRALLLHHVARKTRAFIFFFFTPALLIPTIVLFSVSSLRRLWIPGAVLAATCAGWFASTAGFLPHYAAPITSLVIALSMMGLRRIRVWGRDQGRTGLSLSRWLLASIGLMCMVRVSTAPWPQLLPDSYEQGRTWAGAVGGDGFRRAMTLKELGGMRSLVFVRYAPDHTIHDEWVYNPADIQNATTILARDMGRDANRCVVEAYPGRKVWLLEPDLTPPKYSPYPTQ